MSELFDPSNEAFEEERFESIAGDVKQRQRTRIRYRHAKEALSRLIATRGLARKTSDDLLQQAWKQAVGVRLAPKSRVGQIRQGVLEVLVSHSVVAQELGFMKPLIIKKLQSQLSNSRVRDLRFRVGPLN